MKIITPRFAIKLASALLAATAAFAVVTTAVLAFVGNGNFEAGTFASWTKTVFINNGFSAAHGAGGSDLSVIVGGAAVPALSLSDPHTSGNVRYPAYGHYTARINSDTSYTGGGFAKNGNLITQTIPAYIDPVDNLAHIRFTFAAVMVNPVSSPHTAEEKPYFRVRAINTSNGNDVLYDFQSYVNEPGKNWQDGPVFSGSDTWKYKDWNFVDLTPLPGHPVNSGDNVTLEVTAAGCSLGGHPGYVYIDEITDHEITGPTIRATGPASVNTGSTITYTYNYRNGAAVSVDPTITAIQPTGVTFNAVSDPANCSLSAGTVTCSYTGLAVGGTGSFTISGMVTAAGGSQIAHGDYNIAATGFPTLSGETVLTNVSLNTTILSINRAGSSPTSASPVTWDVTFASPVSNLTASNLALVNTGLGGTPAITNVNAVGSQPTASWTVIASTGSGNGTLGLNMANSTGTSPAVSNVPFTGQVYTIDHAPPDTSITSQPTNPTNSGNASLGYTGTDGSGTGIASYECKLDGAAFAACAANPQTYSGLADGSHTFQVRAIDNVGNVDPTPAVYTWVVDTAPPDTSITSQPSDPTNSSNASLGYSGTDGSGTGIAGYDCKLDGAAFAACAANPQTYSALADGSHTFQVRAIDNVGNVDPTPASYTWVVDTAPPDTSITSQPHRPRPTNSRHPHILGRRTSAQLLSPVSRPTRPTAAARRSGISERITADQVLPATSANSTRRPLPHVYPIRKTISA